MRLTVPYFSSVLPSAIAGRALVSPDGWDALYATESVFGLPATRDEWERALEWRPELIARARDVVQVARGLGARSLASHGVGQGMLELAISREAPDLDLVCSDFSSATMSRLAAMFVEARVETHNLLEDVPPAADLHVLHRVDTDLTTQQWREVIPRFRDPLLFVISDVLTARVAWSKLWRGVLRHPKHRPVHVGWLRTRASYEALWARSHHAEPVTIGDLDGYLLRPK